MILERLVSGMEKALSSGYAYYRFLLSDSECIPLVF